MAEMVCELQRGEESYELNAGDLSTQHIGMIFRVSEDGILHIIVFFHISILQYSWIRTLYG